MVGASIAAGKEIGKETSPAEAWTEKGAEAVERVSRNRIPDSEGLMLSFTLDVFLIA